MCAYRNTMWDMEALQKEINSAFENIFNGRWNMPFSRYSFLPARGARAYPLLNISEDNDNFHVEALAPGVNPESLEVKIVQNQLHIAGEKANLSDDIKPEAYHRCERGAGRFIRTLNLPVQVDPDHVQATYRNGLLQVTVPKAEKAKPRQIMVNVT